MEDSPQVPDPVDKAFLCGSPTVVLNGATATGKSSLAVSLAVSLAQSGHRAEVVNTDSMLVYRGMDIGTAKPSAAERRGIPHHLIDIWPITRTGTVADFQELARTAVADCRSRGVIPILVGGSALYVRAIVDHFDFPGTDPHVRAHWEAELERRGAADLYAELARRDPEAAGRMEPSNGRRTVRALEVLDLRGAMSGQLPEPAYALPDVVQLGVRMPREVMDARIEARVGQMWRDGFVEEVRRLEADGLRDGVTASRAIGYRQVLDHLAGEYDEDMAQERTIIRTRQFARRQLSWFRRDDRIIWLDGAGEQAEGVAGAELLTQALEALRDWRPEVSGSPH
ncbi:tRNA (adenosine(37)-N6)-dimethylallyltransferase MiaA [Parenemella sanctibonifatiensis]|uniref:tRNA (adenosine(37)-N6)-dimethylallyltransferase MiaA n=1 Tax=Parenemella sanctibonifatiensis TaxID=2016505 RepID=UPI001E5D3CC4|nr:tRNA (adenosine(37)-N6)-dimethylallyltransferase MiaA [Parenemella sanctibonifatiensis]